MNIFKTIFKQRASRVWFIVTAVVLVLGIVVNILATTLFYTIFCQVLGRPRAITAGGVEQVFVADFDNKEDARKNGESVNEAMTAEGMVLLKNDGALPLAAGAKISVFGKNSVNIVTGGSGSAAGGAAYIKGLDESLTAAGFEINETLWNFYKDNGASGAGRPDDPSMNAGSTLLYTGETNYDLYTKAVKDSYAEYSDAALIVISRIGGEGWDLPRTMTGMEGARDENDHYLQLDANETKLIENVCAAGFDKVIVLINASSPMELGFLDDPDHYAYNEKIDACMWIGVPGDTGIMSLGRILKGEVNPSGRLPDTYARNFKADPTWVNFGDNQYTNVENKVSSYKYAYVDYEESIYLGYRYYETRWFTETRADEDSTWYEDNVVFPFGYGLSYTTFTQTIANKSALEGAAITADGKIEINVSVTNTGDVPGKDTVQIYVTPPYTSGEIEKPHVMLAGFAKTPLLQPDQSETVTVTIDPYYLASYDYDDEHGNRNGVEGFELDAGDYVIRLASDAHNTIESVTMNLASDVYYDKDPVTENPVVNRYDDADDQLGSRLSRSDWNNTFPQARSDAEKVLDAATNAKINSTETNNPNKYDEFPDQGMPAEKDEEGNQILTFRSLVDKDYNDPLWEELLDLVTVDEMTALFNNGAFSTAYVESINKPATVDADGPAGFADFMAGAASAPVYEVSHYCCEPLMAATFNVELLEDFGTAVGNEALVGNQRGDGMPYSGWYAPGINLHRSPFGGRVGEYFSEDPFLTGMLGAYEIRGAMSKGVYTQVKHFAVNEQETNRTGICTWLDEQALREVYLRPFEMAVKLGGTIGMMSSFNRIGTMWTGGDYRLLTEILRGEWGFRGMVISDYNTGGPLNPKQMAYAGGDLNLTSMQFYHWSPRKSDPTDMTILRNCAKNILYTVNNSNIMNTDLLGYKLPVWVIVMIVVDCALAAGLAVWGVFAIRSALKKSREEARYIQ